MAITHVTSEIKWNTAQSSVSVAASGNATSDLQAINTATVRASVQVTADNDAGSPAADATITFFILYNVNGTDYDTIGPAAVLCELDVSSTGADPQRLTIPIDPAVDEIKIYAVNNGGTDAITVSADLMEIRD